MSTEQARSIRTEGGPLLSVENLRTSLYADKEIIRAVGGISFDIFRGGTVDIVDESGSGRSVTARSIMRLIEKLGRIEGGRIMYDGEDPLDKSTKQMRFICGGSITMVFQNPSTSLNPVYTIGNQTKGAFRLHRRLSGSKAMKGAIELLEVVKVPDVYRHVREYPYQLLDGVRQRAVIVTAFTCDSELPIYDEPMTVLGVTIRAQILEFLEEFQEEHNLGIVLITYDMGVIAETADCVSAMYAGEIVESVPVVELLRSPKHPYTQGLPNSIPGQGLDEGERPTIIEDDVPTPNEDPTYCRFAPQCPKAFTEYDTVHPEPIEVGDGTGRYHASCLLYPDNLPTEEVVVVHRGGGQRGGGTR